MGATMERSSWHMLPRPALSREFFKKRIAVPPEKGAWVWLLGPMAAGLAAAPGFTVDTLVILIGAFAGYMLRQPATLAVKGLRRSNGAADRPIIVAWCAIYGTVSLAAGAWLLGRGHLWVLGLAAPGALLFARHLWLVSKNDERHRIGMDLAAAGMLALTGPALLLAHDTQSWDIAAALWLVLWLQASGSIVHMFLRLEQRRLKEMPAVRERWRRGAVPAAHHAGNVVLACVAGAFGAAPWLVVPAFAVTLVEGILAVQNPPVGHTPRQLGMRQLWVSSAFMVLVAIGYMLWT